jgi:hypothetical protein
MLKSQSLGRMTMVRAIIYASITACVGTVANGEVYQGVYQTLGASCQELTDNYFRIGDGWVGGHESYCEVTRVTNVDRMPAYLLDTRCSAEGMDMGQVRYFIASTNTYEGPGIDVYSFSQEHGSGFTSTYKFCPGVQF